MAASPVTAGAADGPSARATAWLLVGLKARMTMAALRRSTMMTVGTVLGLVWFLSALLTWGAAAWRIGGDMAPPQAVTPVVLIGAVGTLGWWLASVVTGRADATLHAARLAPYPLPRAGLALGQLLGGLVGLAGPLTALALVTLCLLWRAHPGALAVALLTVPVGLLLMLLGNRCLSALMEDLLQRRVVGDLLSVGGAALLILAGPVLGAGFSWVLWGQGRWEEIAAVVAWTPWGAVWALPADVARGDLPAAAGRLAVTGITVVVLWTIWDRALARSLERPAAAARSRGGRVVRGAGLLGRVPARPWAAVAARSAVYWLKDPRYSASLAMLPALVAVLWFISTIAGGAVSGGGGPLIVAGPLIALTLGFAISADIAYDHSAFSLHVVTGLRGRDDRLGRVLGLLVVAVPLLLVVLPGSTLLAGQTRLLPGLVGVCVLALLGGAGVSSVLSARCTYPVPLPGDSPLRTPQGFTVLNLLVQFAVLALIVLLTLPALIPLAIHAGAGEAVWGWAALGVGAVLGPALCWGGIVLGGRWVDARAPELLQEVAAIRS